MPDPRLLNPSGMAVSIATHVAVLTVGLGYAGVRPFETAPVEAIAIDIVTTAEVKEAPPKAPPPLEIPDLSTGEQPAAAAKPAAPPPARHAAAMSASAAAAPAMADAKQVTLQPAAPASQPSWRPPEPDLSVRYQVNLGLPARHGDDFDAAAFSAAKLSTDDVAKFREHLKTCSALPASIAPADKVTIRLRASFLPDGTLGLGAFADRGQRLRQGAAADAGRDRGAGGVPALRRAPGGQIQRVESDRSQLYAAGF